MTKLSRKAAAEILGCTVAGSERSPDWFLLSKGSAPDAIVINTSVCKLLPTKEEMIWTGLLTNKDDANSTGKLARLRELHAVLRETPAGTGATSVHAKAGGVSVPPANHPPRQEIDR
jgi:predicted hotdog family 3-hydroxylacyl-ACP dehydratase